MKIKVCGMTDPNQLIVLGQSPVDFVGLIFYPSSSRYVLNTTLSPAQFRSQMGSVKLVGVFVDADEKVLVETVRKWQLDLVQLHGNESPAYCQRIRKQVKTIKAIRIGDQTNLASLVEQFADSVDYFLFDTLGKIGRAHV